MAAGGLAVMGEAVERVSNDEEMKNSSEKGEHGDTLEIFFLVSPAGKNKPRGVCLMYEYI